MNLIQLLWARGAWCIRSGRRGLETSVA